jgi:hypothetical protein
LTREEILVIHIVIILTIIIIDHDSTLTWSDEVETPTYLTLVDDDIIWLDYVRHQVHDDIANNFWVTIEDFVFAKRLSKNMMNTLVSNRWCQRFQEDLQLLLIFKRTRSMNDKVSNIRLQNFWQLQVSHIGLCTSQSLNDFHFAEVHLLENTDHLSKNIGIH